MYEKKRRLTVIEKTEDALDEKVSTNAKTHFAHPNQTNPIYRDMAKFSFAEKFSVKDLK